MKCNYRLFVLPKTGGEYSCDEEAGHAGVAAQPLHHVQRQDAVGPVSYPGLRYVNIIHIIFIYSVQITAIV